MDQVTDLLLSCSKVRIDIGVPWDLLLLDVAEVVDESISQNWIFGLFFVNFGDPACADYVG